MSTSFSSDKDNHSSGKFNELNEIRNIIVGPEREQIQKIEEKIEVIDKEQLSEILPESLILSSKKIINFTRHFPQQLRNLLNIQ